MPRVVKRRLAKGAAARLSLPCADGVAGLQGYDCSDRLPAKGEGKLYWIAVDPLANRSSLAGACNRERGAGAPGRVLLIAEQSTGQLRPRGACDISQEQAEAKSRIAHTAMVGDLRKGFGQQS